MMAGAVRFFAVVCFAMRMCVGKDEEGEGWFVGFLFRKWRTAHPISRPISRLKIKRLHLYVWFVIVVIVKIQII